MFSLETIGWYSDRPGSQRYPFPLGFFYPSTGNFLAFVANLSSPALLHEAIASFRRQARFPSEGVAAPAFIPGVDWSDQRSFWEQGYPALMVTDTAPYRYPHYHTIRAPRAGGDGTRPDAARPRKQMKAGSSRAPRRRERFGKLHRFASGREPARAFQVRSSMIPSVARAAEVT